MPSLALYSSGFSRGQGRNTTVVGNALYLATWSTDETAGTSRITFGACTLPRARGIPSNIATDIKKILQEKEKMAAHSGSIASGLACKIDVKENRQDGRKEGRTSDLFRQRSGFDAVTM